ncbi:hypothetical protein HanXRQr2_Chr05g0205931 [Helianthus annuus]|uniref:Uncharacterized protein n=1 Tax=Helianthus annuus TaxID=4232 RepID=A0A251UPR9_HELAN|nr:hypothetical protein HanXRQr2_Chr05g0205931 [Helianthus annuus]KAJ0922034.1 hypothetical protein HanPSC8_Chr05g0198791 [Helianthus annuus]
MHASKSSLGNDIKKSLLFKQWNGWNRRTIKSRVLSGVQFLEVLALFASAVQ